MSPAVSNLYCVESFGDESDSSEIWFDVEGVVFLIEWVSWCLST